MDLDTRIAAAIDAEPGREGLSGVLRISRGGGLVFERAYGFASVQLDVRNTAATRFHIASVTKMFISAVIVRLASESRLALDAHPSRYLAELASLDHRITLHHLLTHTSGIADIYEAPDLRLDMTRLAAAKGRLLDYLVALPQLGAPGERWRYSTTGFLLLAYVAEAATATPFDQLLAEMFLRPLSLTDTGADDPSRINPGRAFGHLRQDGAWRNAPNDRLSDVDGPRELYSTAADLDRWATAILEGRVLDEAGLAATFTPHARVTADSGFDPSQSYGYGWFLGPDYRWIGGMTEGFRAALWQYPAERLNVVMLWNSASVDSQRLLRALRPILTA